jgi:hypothetical protein
MIAVSQPSPRTNTNDGGAPGVLKSLHLTASPVWAGVFAFLAFVPYPAIAIGPHTGLQLGDLIALPLAAMTLTLCWKRKPYFFLPLLLLPSCLSLVKVALSGDGSLDLGLKSITTTAISGMSLLATQMLAPRYTLSLLKGIAWAVVLHTAVGIWQLYSFTRGEFPLAWFYVNPSFLSVQENLDTIVNYIQRPFGLFPEPSAMSSSLAPWCLFWIAEMFDIVQLRQRPSMGTRILFATAALGALGLIVQSRSGHASITVVAAICLAGIWLVRCRATVRSFISVSVVFGIVLPVVAWLLVQSLGTRIDGPADVDQSWVDRANSLWAGCKVLINGDPATLIFGVGRGMISPKVQSTSEYETVWSVSLPFIYETGMIGLLVFCGMFYYLAKVWLRSGKSLILAIFFGVWLVGITITTSYAQLLPLWVALGWMTVWPEVCLPAQRRLMRTIHPQHQVSRSFSNSRPVGNTAWLPVQSRVERACLESAQPGNEETNGRKI